MHNNIQTHTQLYNNLYYLLDMRYDHYITATYCSSMRSNNMQKWTAITTTAARSSCMTCHIYFCAECCSMMWQWSVATQHVTIVVTMVFRCCNYLISIRCCSFLCFFTVVLLVIGVLGVIALSLIWFLFFYCKSDCSR